MTHNDINNGWNPKSRFCGKLIQRHDYIWHFSVGLDDDLAMAWGEKHLGGKFVLHQLNNQFIETRMVTLLPMETVKANLHLSVEAFDGKWFYNSLGWNCEHWARLAATGNPVSYQVEQSLFGLLNGFGMFGLAWRPEAVEELKKYSADVIQMDMPGVEQTRVMSSDESIANSPVG